MADLQLIKIFLASPGDVAEERNAVEQVIETINRNLGSEKRVRLETVRWEKDTYPLLGSDAQNVVNRQIAGAGMSDCDLFIGIMWNRFGRPTPRAGSGTEEEFNTALESFKNTGRPEIMFYFNQAPANINTVEAIEQKRKVIEFRNKLQDEGLIAHYSGLQEFKDLLRNHLEKWLINRSPQKLEPPHVAESNTVGMTTSAISSGSAAPKGNIPSSSSAEIISDSGMWVLIDKGFYLAEEVNEPEVNKVKLKIPVSKAEEDAAMREFQPDQYGRKSPIPFAHQNVGAIARVTEAARTSKNSQTFWEITLQLEETDAGFMSEFNFNNFSADEIAKMRARFILLNEFPGSNRYSAGSSNRSAPFGRRRSSNIDDTFLMAAVQAGSSGVVIEKSVLPDLWKSLDKNVELFLPLARLWSVFHLITSNTCEHILELTLGPVKDEKLHVKFRGRRRKQYVNQEPAVIEFEGDCNLD